MQLGHAYVEQHAALSVGVVSLTLLHTTCTTHEVVLSSPGTGTHLSPNFFVPTFPTKLSMTMLLTSTCG